MTSRYPGIATGNPGYPLYVKYLPQTRGHVVFERRVPRAPATLSALRHLVADRLADAGVDAATITDTLVVLSELGTNAMHATGYGEEIGLRVVLEPNGDIDIEVEDPGAGFRLSEGLRLPNHDEEHGRGLAIVCMLADETSVRRRRRHTIVHARICARRSA